METNKNQRAIVQKICLDGKHGPYAVAFIEKHKISVTFSLKSPTWKEERYPVGGEEVILINITKKRAGWRADVSRFYRLSDKIGQ